MTWRTNREKWNALNTDGTVGQREVRRYPLVLAALIAVAVFILPRNIQWRRFFKFVLYGSLVGWAWSFFIITYDPNISAWMYPPWWGLLGDFYGMPGLDFIFYPICGGLFGLLKMRLPQGNLSWEVDAVWLIIPMSIITGLTIHLDIAALSIGWCFGLLAIALMAVYIEKVDLIKFFLMGIIVVIMAAAWDIFLSSWTYYFPLNLPPHSSVWSPAPWAWNFKVPLSIMPWFSIAGWWFIWSLHEVVYERR